MGYLLPFDRNIPRSQDFGANPGWGPNPPGGHNGDDWATPVGTPVRAAGDGIVVFAGEFDDSYADNFGWNLHYGGKMVVLNMDGNTAPYFEYGHNSVLMVKTGQRVKRGDIIALTGNSDGGTGVSTGPHCHVGCLPHNFDLGSSTYGRVNPRLYMTDYPDSTGSLSYASETITPLEEDDMFTDEDRKLLQTLLTKADGGTIRKDLEWQNGQYLSKGDGAYMNNMRDAQHAAVMEALGRTLNKDDGGYIVGLIEATRSTDPDAIAASLIGLIPEGIAEQVAAKFAEKLGAK